MILAGGIFAERFMRRKNSAAEKRKARGARCVSQRTPFKYTTSAIENILTRGITLWMRSWSFATNATTAFTSMPTNCGTRS